MINTNDITITNVFDNYPFRNDLKTLWGFSCYIELPQLTMLFDTGSNGMVLLDNLGEHFVEFVENKILQGRFESTSEAVRAGLRLLEEHESKLDLLRKKLSVGEAQFDKGEGVDGDAFMQELIE